MGHSQVEFPARNLIGSLNPVGELFGRGAVPLVLDPIQGRWTLEESNMTWI